MNVCAGNKLLTVEAPGGADRVLLHACCAPCSGAVLECLLRSGITPVIYYSNANIFPEEEYVRRRDECVRHACRLGLEIVEDPYDHAAWRNWTAGLEKEPERGARCLACFRFRLDRAAGWAASHGIPVLTTTLASSRWKDLAQVDDAGQWACARHPGVDWWGQNWRKGGLQQRRGEIIREQGFYNQTWCGCEFSRRAESDV